MFEDEEMKIIRVIFILVSLSTNLWLCTGECIQSNNTDLTNLRDVVCPIACHCKQKKLDIRVSCYRRGLLNVPRDLPPNTVELVLDNNLISTLLSGDFKGCNNLKTLNLGSNNISRIEKDTFSYTPELKDLEISDNKLNLSTTESKGFVRHLSKLESLLIKKNVYVDDDIFLNLKSLKTLHIDRTGFVYFSDSFKALTHLKTLRIEGYFTHINNTSFEHLSKNTLEKLKIRSDDWQKFRRMHRNSLKSLKNLKALDLSGNRGLGIKGVAEALVGINETNVTLLRLQGVTGIEGDYIIRDDFYEALNGSKITTISLDRNDLTHIGKGLGNALPHLQNLSMTFNRLFNVDSLIEEFFQMPNLSLVNVSFVAKGYLRYDENGFKQNLISANNEDEGIKKYTKLQKNAYSRCASAKRLAPCKFICDVINKYLLPNETKPCTYSSTWCIPVRRNLKTVDLTATIPSYIDILPQITFLGKLNKFRNLIFKANDVEEFTGPIIFANPPNDAPIKIDISDNGAFCIAPDILKVSILDRQANITSIIADTNQLANQFENDDNCTMFQYYKDLKVLSLARNEIKVIKKCAFRNLTNLRLLNLSQNALLNLNFELKSLDKLEALDVSYNLLPYLPASVVANLTEIVKRSNLTLYFKGNPVQCSCNSLPFLKFLKWMSDSNYTVKYLGDMYCDIDGRQEYFQNLTDIVERFDLECSGEFILIVAASIFVSVTFLVVLSICFYRHRWDIRYFLVSFRSNKRQYQRKVDQKINYEYDAFVSYDHRDLSWIRHELIPNLEERESNFEGERKDKFSLCIHTRDFLAGEGIQENILRSIKSSRKVLLILSKHFLDSHWCRIELEMSQKVSFDRGWDIIIPVMLEQLELSAMPASLQMIIRKKTYLEWKDHQPDRDDFWVKLSDVLSYAEQTPCLCECGRLLHEHLHQQQQQHHHHEQVEPELLPLLHEEEDIEN